MFDVIDGEEEFGNYTLLVLPDDITLEGALAGKIARYVKAGGKLILSGASGLRPDLTGFAIPFKASVSGMSEFKPDYIEARAGLDADLVPAPFVMYERAHKVKATGAEVLADVRLPYFNRTWDHFCSHQHTPYRLERCAEYDAVMQDGNVIYFSHPIFQSYYNLGQPLYKYLVRGALNRLLPARSVRTNLPSNGRISLMEQRAHNRLLLHVLYVQTQLRGEAGFGWTTAQKMEIIEDVVPLHNVECAVRLDQKPARVQLASTGEDLHWEFQGGQVQVTLERLYIHDAIVITR